MKTFKNCINKSTKILIVDDEPYVIRSLSFVLKREGYQVEIAKDGFEAIEKVKCWRPCLVFLDIMLPGGEWR